MVMQWIPGTDAEFKAIARTFISVFPETTAWADGSLFIGSLEPLVLRRSDFEWKWQLPGRITPRRAGRRDALTVARRGVHEGATLTRNLLLTVLRVLHAFVNGGVDPRQS